jgi:hypothetical protein
MAGAPTRVVVDDSNDDDGVENELHTGWLLCTVRRFALFCDFILSLQTAATRHAMPKYNMRNFPAASEERCDRRMATTPPLKDTARRRATIYGRTDVGRYDEDDQTHAKNEVQI